MDLFYTKIAYAGAVDRFILNVDRFIINPIILILFAVAVLIFLYGVLEFLMNQANEEKKTTGKSHMIWGVVGITIMLGVWTLLGLVITTLGIEEDVNLQTGEVNLNPPSEE